MQQTLIVDFHSSYKGTLTFLLVFASKTQLNTTAQMLFQSIYLSGYRTPPVKCMLCEGGNVFCIARSSKWVQNVHPITSAFFFPPFPCESIKFPINFLGNFSASMCECMCGRTTTLKPSQVGNFMQTGSLAEKASSTPLILTCAVNFCAMRGSRIQHLRDESSCTQNLPVPPPFCGKS